MDTWEQEALGTSKIVLFMVGYPGSPDRTGCRLAASIGSSKGRRSRRRERAKGRRRRRKKKTPAVQPPLTTHTHKKTLGWDTPVLECPTLAKVYFHKLLFLDNGTDRAFRLRAP
jgi:hypothetical protein